MGSTVLKAETTQDEDDPEPQLLMLSTQFTSSPRGAQSARRLAVERMDQWGY